MQQRRQKLPPQVFPLPQPARPWDKSLRPYLAACRAAYLNAVALKEDAGLLFQHRRYARSVALAVTGLEEAGKSLALWLIGFGRVPQSHRKKLLRGLRFDHRMKQTSALPLKLIGQIIPAARRMKLRVPTPRRPPRNWGEMERLLAQMAPVIVAKAEAVADEALGDGLPVIELEAEQVAAGSLEARRQRALYTDLAGLTIRSPIAVTRAEAAELLTDLRACLRTLKFQADAAAFDDEGVTAVLAATELHDRLRTGAQPRTAE